LEINLERGKMKKSNNRDKRRGGVNHMELSGDKVIHPTKKRKVIAKKKHYQEHSYSAGKKT